MAVPNLSGVIFKQIFPDSSTSSGFNTDSDGSKTQSDEFIQIQNTGTTGIDISGWKIYTDTDGGTYGNGGVYHTFPSGTFLSPGESIFVVSEWTGTIARTDIVEANGFTGTNTTDALENANQGGVFLHDPDANQHIGFYWDGTTDVPNAIVSAGSASQGITVVSADSGNNEAWMYDPANQYPDDGENLPNDYKIIYPTLSPTALTCFTAGSLILTPEGERRIEDLRPGDLVLTRDHGPQVLRWIGTRVVSAKEMRIDPALRPVRIGAGRFGARRDLLVSQQHRLLVADWRADLYFGSAEVLVRAKFLVNDRDIALDLPPDGVTYVHILFDRHEIVTVEGMESESFHPAMASLGAAESEIRAEILSLFPDLATHPMTYGPAARMVLRAHEGRLLAQDLHRRAA